MTTTISYLSGRGWAYIGAALGGTVSIAANVAHSFVPPTGAAVDWSPNGGAVIGGVFWPGAVFVATQILPRVAWPSGSVWQLLRVGGHAPGRRRRRRGVLPAPVRAARLLRRRAPGVCARPARCRRADGDGHRRDPRHRPPPAHRNQHPV